MKARNTKKAYQFFREAEAEKRTFSLQELIDAVGWKESTIKTYLTKKWRGFIQSKKNGYICNGISKISEEEFIRIHSQNTAPSIDTSHSQSISEVDLLINKSREATMSAIQTYNNPFISFRAYGFIIQMIIAYTSLFHAIFEREGINYWYENKTNQKERRRYWGLKSCLEEYKNALADNAMRANLQFFIELRDEIEHGFLPELDFEISGYCQALLSNFEKLLVKEFGSNFALGQRLAIALQLTEYTSESRKALQDIQTDHMEEVREFIRNYPNSISDEIANSQDFCFRVFLIPRIGNRENSSNAAIEFVKYDPNNPEEMDKYKKIVALIREKHVPVANQGKFRASRVVKLINDKLKQEGIDITFNISKHTKAWKLYKIRTSEKKPETCKTEYCQYDQAFNDIIYTQAWVDFLYEKVKNPVEFNKIKDFKDTTSKI